MTKNKGEQMIGSHLGNFDENHTPLTFGDKKVKEKLAKLKDAIAAIEEL